MGSLDVSKSSFFFNWRWTESPKLFRYVARSGSRRVGGLHIPFLSSIVTVSLAHFIKKL
jgi:hypothetical protein